MILRIFVITWFTLVSCFSTGCASGGFKWTRKYATFVNQQQIILRVVLYILTGIVFAVAMLVDLVVFNTMDFWEGRVSANDYTFEKDGVTYLVKHSYEGEQKLRNTKIRIFKKHAPTAGAPDATIEIAETDKKTVNVLENGILKATVESIYDLPQLVSYENGKEISRKTLSFEGPAKQIAAH